MKKLSLLIFSALFLSTIAFTSCKSGSDSDSDEESSSSSESDDCLTDPLAPHCQMDTEDSGV